LNVDYANGLLHSAIIFGLLMLLVKLVKMDNQERKIVCVLEEQTRVSSGGCGVAFRGRTTKRRGG
jgi:hypothetical protein